MAEQDGPPGAPRVVFVHGALDRSTAFLRVVRLLPDLSTTRYDRRGYGKSLAAGASPAFAGQVDDLASVVADRPSVIFGHSLGGVVAVAFAEQHPALAQAVVAYEAPMSWAPWWPETTAGGRAMDDAGSDEDAAERFMRRMVGDARWDALPARTRLQRRAEGPALVAELRSLRPPAPAPYDPTRVAVPVIAACGSASKPHHQKTARKLAEAIPGAELRVVPGAGHGIHLSHPAAVVELVRAALARTSAA